MTMEPPSTPKTASVAQSSRAYTSDGGNVSVTPPSTAEGQNSKVVLDVETTPPDEIITHLKQEIEKLAAQILMDWDKVLQCKRFTLNRNGKCNSRCNE